MKIYKKNSGIESVDWDDVVIESLCWGWIDGIKKSIDKKAYLQRITPRRARSVWSKRNCDHVERLIKRGRMQPSGMVQVQAAKKDGRWDNAYSVSEMVVPEDFILALDNHLEAKQYFSTLSKSACLPIAYGLTSAKKPETRERRFLKYLDMLQKGQKPS